MAVLFRQWDEHVKYYFFSVVSPWNFLATWLAWALAPKGTAAKGVLRRMALLAVLNFSLLVWAISLIGSAAGGAFDGSMDTALIIRNIEVWIPLNLVNNVGFSGAIGWDAAQSLKRYDEMLALDRGSRRDRSGSRGRAKEGGEEEGDPEAAQADRRPRMKSSGTNRPSRGETALRYEGITQGMLKG